MDQIGQAAQAIGKSPQDVATNIQKSVQGAGSAR
jgi:hypothetical protein